MKSVCVSVSRPFRMKRVLPDLIVKSKTFSPTKLRERLLLEYNVERTPDAITKFLKRHPEIREQCRKLIGKEDLTHDNIKLLYIFLCARDFRSPPHHTEKHSIW